MIKKYKQTEVGVIPEDWSIATLREAFPRLDAGVSVNSDTDSLSENYVLKTSAVRNGKVNVQEAKAVIPTDYHRLRCPLRKGSIVISRMNTPLMVGEYGYVKDAPGNVFLPDRLWQVEQPQYSDFSFIWLNYLLNTSKYSAAIRATATGTSNSMKNIAKDRLLDIVIPKDTDLKSIRLDIAAGDIDINDIKLEKLELDANAGDIDINNIISEKINIDANAGDINVMGCTADKIELNVNAGDVDVTGNYGKIDCNCDLGDVDIKAPNTDRNDIDVDCALGSVNIVGK